MSHAFFKILVCLTAPLAAAAESPEFKALSKEQAATWMCHLTPLPRQVQMSEAVVVPASDVVIAQVSTAGGRTRLRGMIGTATTVCSCCGRPRSGGGP